MTYANKKAILKFGVIMIVGVVVASAMSTGVLADAPAESAYSDILNNTDGDGTLSNPYVLTTLEELQAMNGSLSAHYVLANNIDASETENWNNGAGFTPIGNGSEFSGNFDGKGFSVDGLYIYRPNTNAVGLFDSISSDIINISVTNIDIQGGRYVGGLVGFIKGGDSGANIEKSYSSGSVSGDSSVGGLVGYNRDNSNIYYSYSNSNVSGTSEVGGLVGSNSRYITNSYSTGSVTGNTFVGGLVGYNRDAGTVVDSYWNTETSTQSTSAGSAIGLTTAEITGSAASTNMVGFDFTSVWSTVLATDIDSSADSYPILDENHLL